MKHLTTPTYRMKTTSTLICRPLLVEHSTPHHHFFFVVGRFQLSSVLLSSVGGESGERREREGGGEEGREREREEGKEAGKQRESERQREGGRGRGLGLGERAERRERGLY
eukprot:scaffold222953_cov32-Tisochrysis_lutea.AAC.6